MQKEGKGNGLAESLKAAERVAHSSDSSLWDRCRAYVILFLHPSYHIKKFVEDVRMARLALANWDLDSISTDREKLANAFRGRLFATFLLSGIFGVLGPLLGIGFQYSGHKAPSESMLISLVVANIFGTTGYQIIWSIAHRRLYRRVSRNWLGRLLAMERDLLKLQLIGFGRTLLLIMITFLPMMGVVLLLERTAPAIAQVIPFPVLGPMLEMAVVQSAVLRAMGDLFERHSYVLADRYGAGQNGQ